MASKLMCSLTLFWVCLMAAPRAAHAQLHQCCSVVPTACTARPDQFIPQCRAGNINRIDCDTVCCIEHTFDDPCPGVINQPACLPLLTDADCLDSDGDSIIDYFEINGYDLNGNGVIDPEENFPAMGANPMRKDVFVEADCLVASDHNHCPNRDAISDVVQAFANAPVQNPDGTSGVQLHVDVGKLYGAGLVATVPRTGGGAVGTYGDFGGGGSEITETGNTFIDFKSSSGGTSFYSLKSSNFDADRAYVFRYLIFAHQTHGAECQSGVTEDIPGNDSLVTLGGTHPDGVTACWGVDAHGKSVGTREQQAGTFMHEFGHALGLHHGGFEDTNLKQNYLSVMNYATQFCMVAPIASLGLPGGCDYSHFGSPPGSPLIDLDERSLDECLGLGPALGPVDFNRNNVFEGATCAGVNNKNVIADTNNDGICLFPGNDGLFQSARLGDDSSGFAGIPFISDGPDRICQSQATAGSDDLQITSVGHTPTQEDVLKSSDDWSALVYQFQTFDDFVNGVSAGAPPVEPDPQSIENARRFLSDVTLPTLSLTNSAPANILAGQTLTWTLSVKDVGRGPALGTQLVDTLPDGSQQAFALDVVPANGAPVTRTTQIRIPANACPMDLVNTAEATWLDLVSAPYSTSATARTHVCDGVGPSLSVSVSPNQLTPPDHRLVLITATVSVSDNCDAHPVVRLSSVTSNEPDNGLGDGDTANDIQGAAVGTDDRQFYVRAERSGLGAGRTYTATYVATDSCNNQTKRQATIFVPR